MRTAGRLFDVYLAIDWSARSAPSPPRPSPDSVWAAECSAVGGQIRTRYLRTRDGCRRWLRRRLCGHVSRGRRVLAGFDFPFGYPRGFAAAAGLGGAGAGPAGGSAPVSAPGSGAAPWRLTWNELELLIEDAPDNSNNRFAVAADLNERCGPAPGPLWGCPRALAGPHLGVTSPGYPYHARGSDLPRLRWAERQVPGTQSAWKLMGIGSAGSQCLLGIPFLSRLRSDRCLEEVSRVWPFETRLTGVPPPAGGAFVLFAEIWPGIAARDVSAARTTRQGRPAMIKDEAQVRAVVRWLRSADGAGTLAGLLDAPGRLPPGACADVLAEEGWILGG